MSIVDLVQSIENWSTKYKDIADQKFTSRSVATSALKLDNKTPSELLIQLRSALGPHLTDTDNPHSTTANDVNIYSKVEVDEKRKRIVSSSSISFTCLANRDGVIDSSYTGFSFSIQQPTNMIINSKPSIVTTATFDVDTLFPGNHTETSFYLYIKESLITPGTFEWVVTKTKEFNTESTKWIAEIITDATGITNVIQPYLLLIDNYRISNIPLGQSIPVSSGSVLLDQPLDW